MSESDGAWRGAVVGVKHGHREGVNSSYSYCRVPLPSAMPFVCTTHKMSV